MTDEPGVCACCRRRLTGRDSRDVACTHCILNGHFDVDEPGDEWVPVCAPAEIKERTNMPDRPLEAGEWRLVDRDGVEIGRARIGEPIAVADAHSTVAEYSTTRPKHGA